MRLIHCKKCGAAMVTEDALIERMNDAIHELNEKARKSRDRKISKSYIAEACTITKMMKGIIHNTAQMEDRKITCSLELSEIVSYLKKNELITDNKLQELRVTAREKAINRNDKNSKEIERLYGEYNGMYIPSNNTNRDKTSEHAIKRVEQI